MQHLLIQAKEVPQGRIIVLCLIMVAVVVAGLVVVQQIRRRIQSPDEPVSAGFTLADLRQMHKTGQMSDAEFERAKEKVVEAARRATERQNAREAGKAAGRGGAGGLGGSA